MVRGDSSRKVGADALVVGIGYLASFAYPLVSLPFLARTLGAGELGHLMFALAVLQVVIYVVDFGFGMSALRGVAVSRGRRQRSQVVLTTLKAKLLLWCGCAAVLMPVVLLTGLREHWQLYAVGMLLIAAGAMYPAFFLQGIGRVGSFALVTALSRLAALIFLILTVRGPEDIVLAMLWQQFPLLLAALASWFMIRHVWDAIESVPTSLRDVTIAIRESFPLFLSNISAMIMGAANSVTLGAVSTPSQVAFFGAGERFSNAVRGVMRGIVDVMLPRMTQEGEAARRMQALITVGVVTSYALAGLVLVLAAPWFVPWYLGPELQPSVPVMQLMGLALAFVGVTTTVQLHATAAHRFRAVARIALTGALVHLVLIFPASWLWEARGAATALVISEGLLAGLFVIDAVRHRRTRRAAAD